MIEKKNNIKNKIGQYTVYYRSGMADYIFLQKIVTDPDLLIDSRKMNSERNSPRVDTFISRINDRAFFIKRYNSLGLIYRIKNMFRKSKAFKAWENGIRFIQEDISTPTPIVCFEQRQLMLLGDSYLVCEHLYHTINLLNGWHCLDDSQKSRLLRLIGSEIGHMHHKGFLHGDLNWRNILIPQENKDDSVFLVDLDDASFSKHLDVKAACRDLSHFYRDFERNKAPRKYIELFTQHWEIAFQRGKTFPPTHAPDKLA